MISVLKKGHFAPTAVKALAMMAVTAILSACAEPIPKELITPEYAGSAPAQLNIGMTDHRTFILSADKEEWFEGIVRGGFGIPVSLQRPGPNKGQPFAIFLSSMLADGLRSNETEVAVIPVPKGTDITNAVRTVANANGTTNTTAGITFKIIHSRYDVGFSAEYNHHFDVVIADAAGQVVLEKTFSRFATDLPLAQKYNVFDMYAAIYKSTLDEILRDPEVVSALSSLGEQATS